MNIFATSDDPILCARALDDKRLNKMVLESAQIICTVLHNRGVDAPYKPTHSRHPCVLWAGEDQRNFSWLVKHFIALANEYLHRFRELHKSAEAVIPIVGKHYKFSDPPPDTFVNCTNFKEVEDPHLAYKLHLDAKWLKDKRKPKWTRRQPPKWSTYKETQPDD